MGRPVVKGHSKDRSGGLATPVGTTCPSTVKEVRYGGRRPVRGLGRGHGAGSGVLAKVRAIASCSGICESWEKVLRLRCEAATLVSA